MMMLHIDVAATDGQGKVNDDVVGHQGNAAWVIDGATGIGPSLLDEPSDAAWLARTASTLLAQALAAEPERPSADILRRVMAGCAEALAREQVNPAAGPHELPSAAFAMIRVIDGVAEITTLADCRVAALDENGTAQLFGSSALEALEGRTIAAARAILAEDPAISPDALRARLMPGLLANRALMNQPGGYWVLGTNPAAADHLWQTRLPIRPGQRFAVASDGFLRLIELFGVLGPADLLDICGPGDWAQRLSQLRAIESEADSLIRFTRIKRHDDASLVTCHWDA